MHFSALVEIATHSTDPYPLHFSINNKSKTIRICNLRNNYYNVNEKDRKEHAGTYHRCTLHHLLVMLGSLFPYPVRGFKKSIQTEKNEKL